MKWTSALAIFMLFGVMSAFLVMPFFVRTAEEEGRELIPGQAESAPADFKPWPIVGWTSLFAGLSFGLFYANYVNGWVSADMFDIFKS
jgi:predicted secreted protein